MKKELRTNRLVLRGLEEDDHEFIKGLVNTEGWLNYIGDRNVKTTEEAIEYINKIKADNKTDYWVVCMGNQIQVGVVSIIKRGHLKYPDIGFAFLPNHHGKGYAYEATMAVIEHQINKPGHKILLAITLINNGNSIKLIEKLGFVFSKLTNYQGEATIIYELRMDQANEH